jgi:hypothetical protein
LRGDAYLPELPNIYRGWALFGGVRVAAIA